MNTTHQDQRPTQYANNRKGYVNFQLFSLFGKAEALVINLMLYKIQNDPHILDYLNEIDTAEYAWQEIGYGEFSANYGLHQKSVARAIKALVPQGYLLKGATSQNGTLYRLNIRKLIADMERHSHKGNPQPLALGDLALTKQVADSLPVKYPKNQITHEMLLELFGITSSIAKPQHKIEVQSNVVTKNQSQSNDNEALDVANETASAPIPQIPPQPEPKPIVIREPEKPVLDIESYELYLRRQDDYLFNLSSACGKSVTIEQLEQYTKAFSTVHKVEVPALPEWNGNKRYAFAHWMYASAMARKPVTLDDDVLALWGRVV